MSGSRTKVVCVTGASGFIASWLVKLLLDRGYTVKASVRDPNDTKKTGHLIALDGAKERLHLFKADLLDEGSFDSIVDGCEGVFHTASPVLLSVSNPEAELFGPALNGTLNVLRSCAEVSSIKRVVVTSSIAAMALDRRSLDDDGVVDETWFSDLSLCEELKLWYPLSKTLAEKAAWEFTKEHGINMISINPGSVLGPILQPTLNLSVEEVFKLVNGAKTYPNATFRSVDVRDVANAHIQALENPSASGRYLLVERPAHCSEAVKILRELDPALHLPEKCDDSKTSQLDYKVSNEKAKTLGIKFTPLEVSLKDTIQSLKEKNFLRL